MCMGASGASELRKFGHFYILKLLYFFQYFVGTSDTLLPVQMTCLSAYMYRQFPNVPTKLRKSIMGGSCPPPPSGYANAIVAGQQISLQRNQFQPEKSSYNNILPGFYVCVCDIQTITLKSKKI